MSVGCVVGFPLLFIGLSVAFLRCGCSVSLLVGLAVVFLRGGCWVSLCSCWASGGMTPNKNKGKPNKQQRDLPQKAYKDNKGTPQETQQNQNETQQTPNGDIPQETQQQNKDTTTNTTKKQCKEHHQKQWGNPTDTTGSYDKKPSKCHEGAQQKPRRNTTRNLTNNRRE